jgi:hypothetical protein
MMRRGKSILKLGGMVISENTYCSFCGERTTEPSPRSSQFLSNHQMKELRKLHLCSKCYKRFFKQANTLFMIENRNAFFDFFVYVFLKEKIGETKQFKELVEKRRDKR